MATNSAAGGPGRGQARCGQVDHRPDGRRRREGTPPARPSPGGPAGQLHQVRLTPPTPDLGQGAQRHPRGGRHADGDDPAPHPPPGEIDPHLGPDSDVGRHTGWHQVVELLVDAGHIGDDPRDQRPGLGESCRAGTPPPAPFHLLTTRRATT